MPFVLAGQVIRQLKMDFGVKVWQSLGPLIVKFVDSLAPAMTASFLHSSGCIVEDAEVTVGETEKEQEIYSVGERILEMFSDYSGMHAAMKGGQRT